MLNRLWNEDKHVLPLRLCGILNKAQVTFNGGSSVSFTLHPEDEADPIRSEAYRNFARMMHLGVKNVLQVDARGMEGYASSGPVTVYAGRPILSGVEFVRVALVPGQEIANLRAPFLQVNVMLDEAAPVAPGRTVDTLMDELTNYVETVIIPTAEPYLS